MDEPDYKRILLEFIGSLGLSDHMGDALEDALKALEKAGIDKLNDISDWHDLRRNLAMRGVKTLYGTSLDDDTNVDLDLL